MKKLLLVLMVVALSSFLLVGCLGEGVVNDTEEEEEEEEEVVQAVTIEIEDQYPADVKEYIRADDLDVTVTFAEAIPEDKTPLFQAKEAWSGDPQKGDVAVLTEVTGSDRKEWKVVDYDFEFDLVDCAELCLYVTIADCCEADLDEVYFEVVKLDSEDPYVTLYVTVEDCGVCDDKANISFTSFKEGECLTTDECCGDDCSGVAEWTAKLWAVGTDPVCDGYCVELSGGCQIDESTGCGEDCLVFDTDEFVGVAYWVEVTMTDNVGNTIGGPVDGLGLIVLDTDEIVHIDNGYYDEDLDAWILWDMCDQNEEPS